MSNENITEILIKPSNFFRKKSTSFKPKNNNELNLEKLDEIVNLTYIGEMEVSLNQDEEILDKIIIIKIALKNNLNKKSNKKYQYDLAKKILRINQINTGIFIFTDTDSNEEKFKFRFSLIFSEYRGNQRSFSNFKRFTYFVSSDESNKTFEKRIINGNFNNLESIKEAFSVEKVTEEFYKEIFKHYLQLTGGQVKENNKIINLSSSIKFPSKKESAEIVIYSIKVISRLLFIWFLKYKKDTKDIPLVDSKLISSKAVENISRENKFYTVELLNPILFEILNLDRNDRSAKYDSEIFNRIPYLNGGLFTPIPELDYYSLNNQNVTIIDNNWYKGFFETLEKYNFTIDENSPNDAEISVDPEMLGKVFEELQAYINPETKENTKKKTGSYYTRKEIVNYMIDQSLTENLHSTTNIDRDKLNALITYDKEDDEKYSFTSTELDKIVEHIYNLKILDPACGSGAYPIGFLSKLVYVLGIIDPECEIFKEKILKDSQNSITIQEKSKIENNIEKKNFDYLRKVYILKNSIYGIDIQPTAVEITKLRSFLSLLIDQQIDEYENRGLETLPNLDFKFVCANTLVNPPVPFESNNNKLFTEEDSFEFYLSQAIKNYYSSKGNGKETEKENIRRIIDNEVTLRTQKFQNNTKPIVTSQNEDLTAKIIDSTKKVNKKYREIEEKEIEMWKSYKNIFSNQPVNFYSTKYFFPNIKDGFDIIIGNPPYIDYRKIDKDTKNDLKKYRISSHSSMINIYTYFFEKGLEFVKTGGVLAYITPQQFLILENCKGLRDLIRNYEVILLADFARVKIFDASTYTFVTIIKKNSRERRNGIYEEFDQIMDLGTPIKKLEIQNPIEEPVNISQFYNILKKIEKESNFTLGDISKISCALSEKGIYESDGFKFLSSTQIKKWHIETPNRRISAKCYSKNSLESQRGSLIYTSRLTKNIRSVYIENNTEYLGGKINIIKLKNDFDYSYINCLLNSKLINFWFREIYILKHMQGEALPIDTTDLCAIPVRYIDEYEEEFNKLNSKITFLLNNNQIDEATTIENEINSLVYKIYSISSEDLLIIEEYFNKFKIE